MANQLTIGKVAALTGVSVDALRFYERKGLLPQAERNSSGYRVYTPAIVERIHFLKRARAYGFSLDESRQLIAIIESGPAACGDIKERIHGRIADINARIAQLEDARERLAELAQRCIDHSRCHECHLIKAIAQLPIPEACGTPA